VSSATNETLANRPFEEIEQLEEALAKRCVGLPGQTEVVEDLTGYHRPSLAARRSEGRSTGFGMNACALFRAC